MSAAPITHPSALRGDHLDRGSFGFSCCMIMGSFACGRVTLAVSQESSSLAPILAAVLSTLRVANPSSVVFLV